MPDSTAILSATWLTAIAVIGALVVAVWVALRDRWTRLSGAADLSKHRHAAHICGDAEVLIVELENRGVSRVVVTGAYWRIGWFKPDRVPVSVPKVELLSRVESRHGTSFPIVLDDVHRTLISAARDRQRPVALIVRTTIGGEVRCGLTRAARRWISSTGA